MYTLMYAAAAALLAVTSHDPPIAAASEPRERQEIVASRRAPGRLRGHALRPRHQLPTGEIHGLETRSTTAPGSSQRGQRRSEAGDRSKAAEAGETSPEDEYASPELARLATFVGPWAVTETHFNELGAVVATVNGSEEIAWVLDRHAIRRVYHSGTSAPPYEAIGMLTWSAPRKRYEGVWLDNSSMSGVSRVSGEWNDDTRTMVLTIESSGKDGAVVRHRVIERFLDEEHRTATTYLLKGKEVIKRMEVQYARTVPCPARLRPIFDEVLGRRGG